MIAHGVNAPQTSNDGVNIIKALLLELVPKLAFEGVLLEGYVEFFES